MKIWQKNYQLNKEVENFTVGVDYLLDQKLLKYDCKASIAHAKMLKKIKILSSSECEKLIKILKEIIQLDTKGKFVINKEDEDCHTAIENYLVKKLGDTGKKIHTARSRNDQIITALRLYYKNEIYGIFQSIDDFINSLNLFKEKYNLIQIPGYTHMRKAMPSSVVLWTESFIESMKDNKKLLLSIFELINQSPLGTGAGYGIPTKIDRKLTAKLLEFKKIQKNPIYVQNSRGKFESSILHSLTQIMYDLNKISSDLILFTMPEVGYFELPSDILTGSSIMPHKKNPDVLELVRAKYNQLLSQEIQVKTIIGNLISGYNRDLQLTKEPTINGFEITKSCLQIMILVFSKLKANKENCEKAITKELFSVQKAYKLVENGITFRDAYRKISNEFS